jgi:hypothetical protein
VFAALAYKFQLEVALTGGLVDLPDKVVTLHLYRLAY